MGANRSKKIDAETPDKFETEKNSSKSFTPGKNFSIFLFLLIWKKILIRRIEFEASKPHFTYIFLQ